MKTIEIKWLPMTGGRKIPSILPCWTVEEFERDLETYYRYKRLNKQAFVTERFVSHWPPKHMKIGLPVLVVNNDENNS